MTTLDGADVPVHTITPEDQEAEARALRERLGETELRLGEIEQELVQAQHALRLSEQAAVQARTQHEQDVERIGERLMNEAANRDWCGEYDSVVADLNRHLHIALPRREYEYVVAITVTVPISVTVHAADEDDAERLSRGRVTPLLITQTVRTGRFEVDEEVEVTLA